MIWGSLAFCLVLGLWKRAELLRLARTLALFWPRRIVANFSAMDRIFFTAPVILPQAPPSPLPEGPAMALPAGWGDWLARRSVTAVVVLHKGQVVHEDYRQGTGRDDLRISWSLAKSWLSLLVGQLLEDGTFDSLDVPVIRHVPALAGTAYDGATLRDLLQMTSGVVFDEDYLAFFSDVNRMGRVIALGRSMDAFAAARQDRFAQPGTTWAYVSIDTHVIGMMIRGATGRAIPALMAEKLMGPMGLDAAPYFLADAHGTAFVLGGLNMCTRDYARLGLLVLQEGTLSGRQIVPADWVRTSTAPLAPTEPGALRYGYQWWIPADGTGNEVLARGMYGQFLYVHRSEGVVIAVNAADRRFRDDGAFDDALQMFRAIADGRNDRP